MWNKDERRRGVDMGAGLRGYRAETLVLSWTEKELDTLIFDVEQFVLEYLGSVASPSHCARAVVRAVLLKQQRLLVN